MDESDRLLKHAVACTNWVTLYLFVWGLGLSIVIVALIAQNIAWAATGAIIWSVGFLLSEIYLKKAQKSLEKAEKIINDRKINDLEA